MKITEKNFDGVYIKYDGENAEIGYGSKAQKMRAEFMLNKKIENGEKSFEISETPVFDLCGPMIDVSRGGVMTAESVCRFVKKCAQLGLNMIMLYTEDVYEMPEYKSFGYMRGRYSAEELRRIDSYASSLGVEVIPCIQTLGHLAKFLRLGEAPAENGSVLLCGDEKVYKFIECEIKTMSEVFKSRRIHLGMDEADGLGLGKYLSKHGLRDKMDIFNEHLKRVLEIATKYGFEPMIWSDMYFSSDSPQDYYEPDYVIPQHAIDNAPENVSLVFWDYYHKEYDYYDKKFIQHERFKNKTVFAGGIWTWDGYVPNFKYTLDTMAPALSCAAKHGVKTVLATMWGNDGTETPMELAESSLAVFSEYCYKGDKCTEEDIFRAAEYISGEPRELTDAVAAFHCGFDGADRVGKSVIYGDLLLDTVWHDIDYASVSEIYEKSLETVNKYKKCRYYAYYNALFSAALKKADIMGKLRPAYETGDKTELARIALADIPELSKLYQNFYNEFKKAWLETNKVFGFEKFQHRFGGMNMRFEFVSERLLDYAEGRTDKIDELCEEVIKGINKTWRDFADYSQI